jgi:DNA-binding MarR family transcriptional regulator
MVLSVLKTGSVIRRVISKAMEAEGLTPQQYNVLRILRGAGQQGLPTLAIAERLVEEAPGMTRLVDRMEKQGWVERERSSTDRRQVFCRITPAGLEAVERVEPRGRSLEEEFARRLAPEEAERLVVLLEKVRKELK